MADKQDIRKQQQEAEMENLVCDALLERPITFQTQDGRFYYLYQPSLGIQLLIEPILRSLDIDKNFLEVNSMLELTRVITTQRKDVLRLIAYLSFRRRSDVMQEELMLKRIEEFEHGIDTSDLLTLFSYVTSWSTWTRRMQEFYHMDKEREDKEHVHSELSKKGGLVFGGRSIYGRLIDFACQRYGWQLGYVLWGISITNLNMMMADSISTVQLTKEEMSKMGVSNDREYIDADDPSNWQRIRQMLNRT